ncbi:LLM class flavin-dependent oxidoreductase [Chloroflexia bacterium SDU3-3]|nr:LLM class flavin-dependent oxidoreductase [Chloroflexia bacterium SDU3-3]
MIPLSILDLTPVSAGSTGPQALQNTLDLARRADALGYTRYWLAEHHNIVSVASTAPEVLIGQVARETTRIRVGSGGIMLPNHAPLHVAETFRTLEALFPGRIDLGLGRAPGTDQLTAYALRRSREALGADDFPAQLAELQAFGAASFPDDHPFHTIMAGPPDVALPPIWVLGSSGFGAQLAAEQGLGFAFAHHINPHAAVAAARTYRQNFRPSPWLAKPQVIVAVAAVVAETDELAREISASLDLVYLRLRGGRPGRIPSPAEARAYPYTPAEREVVQSMRAPQPVGSPATVRERLLEIAEQTQADELMVNTTLYDHAARVRSYELLAEAWAR